MSNVMRLSYSRAELGSLIRSKPCKISITSGSIKTNPMLLKASWKENSVNSGKVHSSLRFNGKSFMNLLNLISCHFCFFSVLEIVSLIADGSRRLSHNRMQSKRNSGLYATPPTFPGRCIRPERTWVQWQWQWLSMTGFQKSCSQNWSDNTFPGMMPLQPLLLIRKIPYQRIVVKNPRSRQL